MEDLLQLLAEFLLQLILQVLLEFGVHSIKEPSRRTQDPLWAAFGYAMLGALFGLVSVWILPPHPGSAPLWRAFKVVVVPIAAGAAMALLGAWRRRRGDELLRIDHFWNGFLFAFTLALVRFFWIGS